MSICSNYTRGTFPSARECLARQCPDLGSEVWPPESNNPPRKICNLTGRIPGNMGKCPKEEPE